MFANRVLTVFVEGSGKPHCCAIRKRAKASIEMVESRIDKLHRNNEAAEHFSDSAMRFDVGAELVTAKKCIASEKRVAFAFEIVIIWQPRNLVAAFFHPAGKMRRFASALFVPEITRNELLADSEAGIGGKNHIRQLGLRRDELDSAIQFGQRCVQTAPLRLRERRFSAARAAHPGINFVLDAVVIRRAKQELAHKIDSYLSPD